MSSAPDRPRPSGSAAVHDRLAARGIAHELIEHPVTYSAGEEARAVGVPAGLVAKTVVAVDRDHWWLAVLPASRQLDLRRLRDRVGASSHLRLATEAEIAAHFADFDLGATPPLGRMIGAAEVLDPRLLGLEAVVCPAGDHGHALRMSPEALVEAADPDVADICVHLEEGHRTRFMDVPYL